jgi:hypothetical protein
MIDPAAIRIALADHKRAGVPFALAWSRTVGPVPRVTRGDGGVAVFTYTCFKAAYLNEGGPRNRLEPGGESDDFGAFGPGGPGKSRPTRMAA